MAPVVATLSTTGIVWQSSGVVSTNAWRWLKARIVDWLALVNEPGSIELIADPGTATSYNSNNRFMFGLEKASTGNSTSYGAAFSRPNASTPTWYFMNFYGYSPGSANLGYGNYTDINPIGSSNNFWGSGDGITITVIYCADAGDQYFIAFDNQWSTPWGLFRTVRPSGPTYPDKQFCSEWVQFGFGSAQYASMTNQPFGPAFTGYGRNFEAPVDPYYVFSGFPVFSKSLYLGNAPPGIGRHGGSISVGNRIQNGSEYWRVVGGNYCIRETL